MVPYRRYIQASPLQIFTTALFLSTKQRIIAVQPSPGCYSSPETGIGSDLEPGETKDFDRTVPGTESRTHRITIPNDYDATVPSPLMLYFHGWGSSHESCGSRCDEAADRGILTVSMSGYGREGWQSWNHGGSSSSPGPEGATCTAEATSYCDWYSDSGCDCSAADNCWWTTCWDSVEQTLAVLDEVEQDLCVDLDQIWAVGCSNGGMFTFELAVDERSASRLAGIVPIVGLPHYGYSRGPTVEGIRMMGMWGETDTIVPPISNTDNPDKTEDTSSPGWLYTSSNKVMSDWTTGNGCSGNGHDPLSSSDKEHWGISSFGDSLTCTQGCDEQADSTRVVGCVFNGGHVCGGDFIWEPVFNFMLDATTVTPTSAAPSEQTIAKITTFKISSKLSSSRKKWKVILVFVLKNANEDTLSDIKLKVQYTKNSNKNETKTCTSSSKGKCKLIVKVSPRKVKEMTLEIINVDTPSGLSYNAESNTKFVYINKEKTNTDCSLFSGGCPSYQISLDQ